MPGPDILKLRGNPNGRDAVIADLHGNKPPFDDRFNSLNEGARLIVLGDMIDRGENSKELALFFAKYDNNNRPPGKPRIYAIKGNHEEMFLQAFKDLRGLSKRAFDSRMADYRQCERNRDLAWYSGDLYAYACNGGRWAFELTQEEFNKIYDYFDSLPIMISIIGKISCDLIHADKPKTHRALIDRTKGQLTESQKNYALEARPPKKAEQTGMPVMVANGRNKNETITAAGHNAIGPHSDAVGYTPAWNLVNLDYRAFQTGVLPTLFIDESKLESKGESKGEDPITLSDITTAHLELADRELIKESTDQIKFVLKEESKKVCDIANAVRGRSVKEIDDFLRKETQTLSNVLERKNAYLSKLEQIVFHLDQKQRKEFITHLVQRYNWHPLAEERSWFRSPHSIQTRSMFIAFNMLIEAPNTQAERTENREHLNTQLNAKLITKLKRHEGEEGPGFAEDAKPPTP